MKLADLELTRQQDVIVARLVGEIDMSNADELRLALAAGMPSDARAMVLDLTGVDYLDSAGIRLVYVLGEDLQARRQRIQIVVPATSMVADVLRLAGVSDHLGAVETLDEALGLVRDA
jgi:anti-sigma B factor antagonist